MSVRVLIVDDSAFIREALSEGVHSGPVIDVVGIARSGEQALSLLARLRPDLITLDLSLPGTGGFVTLAEIRKVRPDLPVILLSSFSESCAANLDTRFRAATVYIKKPALFGSSPGARHQFRGELISKIRLLCSSTAVTFGSQQTVATSPSTSGCAPVEIVVLGASTGGPEALAELIAKFPSDFPVPILIVQHMPANVTRHFAERLDALTPLRVREGRGGELVVPGQVWIAPGDYHMTVAQYGSEVVLMTNQHAPEEGCRPSVDVLFRSVARVFGIHVLAAVLTGMGADGTSGARAIWEAGGEVIVQDESTSAIWGMPRRVAAAGFARTVCPLGSVPFAIMSRVYGNRQPGLLARAAVAR